MSSVKKTFIILSPGFPADESDSTCLPFIQSFAQHIQQDNTGLQVIVLSFQYPFTNIPYRFKDVTVIPFNGRNRQKLKRLRTWWLLYRQLKKIIRTTDVRGILSFWLGEAALAGQYAGRKYGIPSFIWMMGRDAQKNNRYVSLIRPKAEKLIALSDFLSDEFYRNYRILPAHIIPPGIDRTDFSNTHFIRDIDIIGAGSLIKLKQFDVFINVVKEISKIFPQVKAVICGEGPERKKLFEQIGEAGLHANIILAGETAHSELLNLMQRSKILLHPSSYEGFGVVYAEALYAGAKVVCFRSPMEKPFKNQYTAADISQMIKITGELLADESPVYEPVLTYTIEDSCKKILSLYNIL